MEGRKRNSPSYNKAQDERSDDTSKEEETVRAVRSPDRGSYYYDDSTGYEVYLPDDDGENDEPSDEDLIGKQNKESGQTPNPLSEEH